MDTRVISMGAGVQTTAMLIKYGGAYKSCIFADTLNENVLTYAYIEKYLKPFCAEHDISWVPVGLGMSVLQHAAKSKWPTYFFDKRQCTRDHKVHPIQNFVKSMQKMNIMSDPVVMDIGFSYDEAWRRINTNHDVPYITKKYPLNEDKITRADCEDIIKDYGWPVPPKSGCVMCPIAGMEKIRQMFVDYPAEWNELARIESEGPKYPKYTLKYVVRNKKKRRVTLKDLLTNQSLISDMDPHGTCNAHSCFT